MDGIEIQQIYEFHWNLPLIAVRSETCSGKYFLYVERDEMNQLTPIQQNSDQHM